MKYTKNLFKDGQINITINETLGDTISERINTYTDLFMVKSIANAYKNLMPHIPMRIFIPCLLGQRSDRRFDENQSFDLKIICDFINSCGFEKIIVFDPHSDVCLGMLNNSVKQEPLPFVKLCLQDTGTDNIVLVSPDAGAYKKVFKYAQELNLPLIAANKFRASDNNITLSILGDVKDKECLIVDDYADGGRTFVELAKKLKEQGASRVCLYVSHGLFSYGFDEIEKHIDRVFCTNSIQDIRHPLVTQFAII